MSQFDMLVQYALWLDLFAWCVRLSRLLVGFRMHLKSPPIISYHIVDGSSAAMKLWKSTSNQIQDGEWPKNWRYWNRNNSAMDGLVSLTWQPIQYKLSHAGMVVAECFKDDNASQWKSGKFDPCSLKHPWTDVP